MIIGPGITIGNGISLTGTGSSNDPYWSSVTTLLSANNTTPPADNNTFLDSSTNNFSITRAGNATQGRFNPFTPSAGGSLYFDGNGDYLNLASNAAFNLTGNFTIEYWFYDDGSNLNYPTIISNVTGWTTGSFGLRYNNTGLSNKVSVHWNGAGDPFIASTSTYATKTWHHVAFTRSGTTCTLWVNGTNQGTGTYSTALNLSFGGLNVGWSAWDGAQGYFKGYVSNLRVVNGTALYTSTFTPSTTPLTAVAGTSLLLSGTNAGIYDSSLSTDLETIGTSLTTSVVKYGSTSMQFNGSSDYLLSKPNQALEFGSGDFTIEFWWYRTLDGRQALYHGSFGTDWSLGIDFASVGTNTIGIWASSNGTSWNLINADSGGNGIGTIQILKSSWTHVAFVRSGTTWYSFINGVGDKTLTGISGAVVNRASSAKAIGAWFSLPAMTTASGLISDLRITKGVARYTGNFTPPTQPFPQN